MSARDEDLALEGLLRAGRADPSEAQLRRVEERFDAWLAESSAPPSGTYPTATAARRPTWVLPFVGAGILVLGAGLFQVLSSDGGAPAAHESRRSSIAPDRVTIATGPARSARLSAPALTTPPALTTLHAPAVAHVEPPRRTLPEPAEEAAPPPGADQPATEQPAATTTTEARETEVSYLRRTRAALKTEPAQALQMADDHPSRFPRGALDQERELIAIDALVRLGRTDEARTRAASFHARYPSSAHRGRVDALVGGSR